MSNLKTLIFIPTYNERENVEQICSEILHLGLDADLLFADDNSPDGTGEILDRLAASNKRIFVIHRPHKFGIGRAHQAGIRWAYERDYRLLVTMDCDFTHNPIHIRRFLELAKNNDVVVGSRYLRDESLKGWNLYRKSLTRLGHWLTRIFLGMPHDATGAFRLYRLDRIPPHLFDRAGCTGYAFFFQSLYLLHLNRFKIREIPIDLPVRTYGHSKMSSKEILRSVSYLLYLYAKTFFRRRTLLVSPAADSDVAQADFYPDWDDYWSQHENASNKLYNLIAVFYRKFLIRPTLNHHIRKTFPESSRVLHAGCGSGMVDTDITEHLSITALDISRKALQTYGKINNGSARLFQGDIFHLPAKSRSFDGIYNLGVMEHFTEEEIHAILSEFHRVLKPKGKMVIFWPPEFGLSVIFLKCVHFFFNSVIKKKKQFHPAEITRIRSREHVCAMFRRADLEVLSYNFGLRDFFTYCIVVASKQ